jgi:hypothetical protein
VSMNDIAVVGSSNQQRVRGGQRERKKNCIFFGERKTTCLNMRRQVVTPFREKQTTAPCDIYLGTNTMTDDFVCG